MDNIQPPKVDSPPLQVLSKFRYLFPWDLAPSTSAFWSTLYHGHALLFFVVNLSYIEMNQPWVYMCSPSRSPLPPPSPPAPSRFSQCTRSERLSHASNHALLLHLPPGKVPLLHCTRWNPRPSISLQDSSSFPQIPAQNVTSSVRPALTAHLQKPL